MFKGASTVGLNGLKCTNLNVESTVEWEKRKEVFIPDLKLPTNFQELLKDNFRNYEYPEASINTKKASINTKSLPAQKKKDLN